MARKKIVDAKATSSKIIVEHIPASETLETKLIVSDNIDAGPPQAIILSMGPGLKPDECGFKVGDRVVLSGKYVPLPQYGDKTVARGIVEMHDIKAVLVEADE